ncbi:hypothetical protein [Viridibacillus arvi]|uniref:hypothetical protein n=1 Tax=Viridibacillus arvi TaxID=263475 RepID=UPI0034CD600C
MVIDIFKETPETRSIQTGDVIVARHKIAKDKVLYYKLIQEGSDGTFRLLNLISGKIMATFASKDPLDAFPYVEIAVKSEIVEIVPFNKLKLTTINESDIKAIV